MKLIKVTFEYDTHTDTLEGKEVEDWLSAVNGAIGFNAVHGVSFPRFNWKKVKKPIHARK